MEADFWHRRWEQNDIGFHQRNINPHLQQFWNRLDVAAGGCVFVPLCGKSQDMLWLTQQGHPVLGVELSPVAVGDFFRDHGLTPENRQAGSFQVWQAGAITLLCGDYFALTPADLADVAAVYDRAALIALPPAMRQAYVDHLAAILPRNAEILLINVEYPQDVVTGPPFSVDADEVRVLYERHFQIELLADLEMPTRNQRFLDCGINSVVEKVFRLRPLASSSK